jgi:hypothetical protein
MSQDCPMLRLKDDSVCSKDDDFSFLRIYGSSTHTHLYFSVSKVSSVNLTSFGAFLALKSPNELAKPDLNACVPPKLRYLLTAKPDETGRP